MQNVLKGWLIDNTVTTDDLNDKILQLESAGKADFDDIIDEMLKEDTGLRIETLRQPRCCPPYPKRIQREHRTLPCRSKIPRCRGRWRME